MQVLSSLLEKAYSFTCSLVVFACMNKHYMGMFSGDGQSLFTRHRDILSHLLVQQWYVRHIKGLPLYLNNTMPRDIFYHYICYKTCQDGKQEEKALELSSIFIARYSIFTRLSTIQEMHILATCGHTSLRNRASLAL